MEAEHVQEEYDDDTGSESDLATGPPMTESELEEYQKMVEESDGFDVDPKNSEYLLRFGLISPMKEFTEYERKRLIELSCYALRKHNEENDTELEFVRVIKANQQCLGFFRLYITLEAKDRKEIDPKVYQLQVWDGVPEPDVEMFRLKPSSPTTSSKKKRKSMHASFPTNESYDV